VISDLLIRHERLSHAGSKESSDLHQEVDASSQPVPSTQPHHDPEENEKSESDAVPHPDLPLPSPPEAAENLPANLPAPGHDMDLCPITTSLPENPVPEIPALADAFAQPGITEASPPPLDPGMDFSLDGFTGFFEPGDLGSYTLSLPGTTRQPRLTSAFDSFMGPGQEVEVPFMPPTESRHAQASFEEPDSLSQFCSRLPPVPDYLAHGGDFGANRCGPASHGKIFNLSSQDRELVLRTLANFTAVIPNFQLPSAMSLSRYIRGYVEGFHEHLPFLHINSMSLPTCSIELLLSMAAVGAQYCFEAENGVGLFHAARAIANERIRRRDVSLTCPSQEGRQSDSSASQAGSTYSSPTALNGPLGIPSSNNEGLVPAPDHDLIQTAQALLILMAMATWGRHSELLREALAIQSILASIIREHGLRMEPAPDREFDDWHAAMRYESVLRTKYIVFCFFNLHSIVYDIPPLLLSTELQMRLPCSSAEFKADTEVAWQEARGRSAKSALFQDALRYLLGHGQDATGTHSSLASYVLIHTIIQHIFLIRHTARCRANLQEASLTEEDAMPLENALRSWQQNWERSPESSLDPNGASGPLAFNSTALLRLAYVRLSMDTGPSRALGTRDPLQIAHALHDMPAVKRSPKLTRALLHSAHALSIPIKIGIQLVAKTQTFIWSIQHSLSSLECALLLSKWLETVSRPPWSDESCLSLNSDERKILRLVRMMLDETDFAVPDELCTDAWAMARLLNIGVLRVWATIFKGSQTWAIVDVIGSALGLYANMVEASEMGF